MTTQTAGECPVSDWHKTRLRVPLFEVDLGQAVYHGNYFHLFELGREAFLRDLGHAYSCFMEQQLHLTIVEVTCSYRRALRYDDLINVYTGVLWWRRRSIGFGQYIFRVGNDDPHEVLCTKAVLNMVCVSFNGKPTTLPRIFVELLRELHPATERTPG
jgi:acyl-CoA thioester hydrolase